MIHARMLRSVLTACALLSVACGASLAEPPLTVGSAVARPGTVSTGYLTVPPGVDAGTEIPVVVIAGKKPGRVVALVSGLHGTEYASILALESVIGRIDPEQLTGTVIVVPLVNVASFEQKVPHVNPVDRKSMNRYYPGRADGTQTERASALITHAIVDQADFLIDYHGGDLDEDLRPYSYWAPVGREPQDQVSRHMALAFGLDHIIIDREQPTDATASKYLSNTAALRGKPSLVVEAGHAGTTEAGDVASLINGTMNVLRYLKALPGAAPEIENPVWIERVVTTASPATGIFYPLVQRGSFVQAGMRIGYVTDFFGRSIYDARAAATGVVLYICAVPSMNSGGTIANIGVVAASPP